MRFHSEEILGGTKSVKRDSSYWDTGLGAAPLVLQVRWGDCIINHHGIGLLVEMALGRWLVEWNKLACGDGLDRPKDEGGVEVPTVVGTVSGAPPLGLEVRRLEGSGGCHNFHQCCGGRGVFVSVQKNNNNTLDTKPNCKIVQDSTKSTHDIIVLENSTKI